jgi:hypothetical protein
MCDFKPGTEETPDASAYPAQVSHFSAERRHSRKNRYAWLRDLPLMACHKVLILITITHRGGLAS